jgi:hypothetical protein
LPVVAIRMKEGEGKPCPFVGEGGCTVYEDRPWPCRMYPVGLASQHRGDGQTGEQFYFVVDEPHCKGHGEAREWSIAEWMKDQGVELYDQMGELFQQVSLHQHFQRGGTLDPMKMEMYFTACYDLDKFRGFVFGSRFLTLYEIEPETIEQIRGDDVALLRFAFLWLRFSLFGEKTIGVRPEVLEAKRRELEQKGRE